MRPAFIFLLIVALSLFSGCLSKPSQSAIEQPIVAEGDEVLINYIERVADTGELIATSYEEIDRDDAIKKSRGYVEAESYEPIGITVGSGVMPAIEDALIGMRVGDEKEVHIPAQDAYGDRLDELIRVIPRQAVLPKIVELPLGEFNVTPKIDEYVNLRYWRARVIEVTNESVALRNEPEDGLEVKTTYGPAIITTNSTHVTIFLSPEKNSFVDTPFGEAKVIDYDNTTVTLDHNHPLSGRSISFTFKVERIEKPR